MDPNDNATGRPHTETTPPFLIRACIYIVSFGLGIDITDGMINHLFTTYQEALTEHRNSKKQANRVVRKELFAIFIWRLISVKTAQRIIILIILAISTYLLK